MKLFNWVFIKKWFRRCTIFFGVIYVLGVIDLSWPRTPSCPVEQHSFKGQEFDLELCLNLNSSSQSVAVLVYSKRGELLALRSATFANEGRVNYMAIEDNLIRYSDDTSDLRSASIPEDCVLNMPPTWVDWLEARLPGGIPGVNHCGVVSDEISAKARQSWRTREEAERQKRGEPPLWPVRPAAPALKEHP